MVRGVRVGIELERWEETLGLAADNGPEIVLVAGERGSGVGGGGVMDKH